MTKCLRLPFLAAILQVLASPVAGGQPTATEIVERADQLTRGDTQQGTYEMRIVRPDWERSTTFEFWSEGTEKAFIRVLEPARDRGVTFLKLGREMWNYIPRVNRVIKIPPSMMLQSWMGSDFTNDDLVKESSVVEDYEHRLLGSDTLDGDPVWHVELIPKPEAAVAWARLEEWIRKVDYVPIRAVYFNERGEQVRTMRFTDIRRMGGRVIPTRYELIEETKPGHRTLLILDDVSFNRPIEDRVFTQQNLRRGS